MGQNIPSVVLVESIRPRAVERECAAGVEAQISSRLGWRTFMRRHMLHVHVRVSTVSAGRISCALDERALNVSKMETVCSSCCHSLVK